MTQNGEHISESVDITRLMSQAFNGTVAGASPTKIDENRMDSLANDDVILMIGQEDQLKGREFYFAFSKKMTVVMDKKKGGLLNKLHFDNQSKEIRKNGQPIQTNGEILLKKLTREFRERNKNIYTYKGLLKKDYSNG
jgi:hypothetical protein